MAHRNGAPDVSTSCSSVSSPSTTSVHFGDVDADFGGVQRLRRAEVIDPGTVPDPPPGAVPVEVSERVSQLSRVAGGNVAELVFALDHVAANPAVCVGSPYAPERAARVAARIRKASASEARLERALAVTRQQRAIAVSDGHQLAVDLADDVNRAAKRDPAITQRHAPLVAYAELPSQAVKNGIARTRAKKAKADKKAQAEKPDGDKPTG